MKEIKLIRFELHKYIAWPIKLVLAILALYFANEAFTDHSNEYVIRRGIQYTLIDSPRSFYINLTKTVGISLACLYLAIGGVVPKKSNDRDK